ncbi:MAG: hypothetical protein D6757_07595 [Alphaproteobacteria bacterium]|nr:MAG: hypothetical protein D6757_07595 [Alphaproteobacteria bacterium]
MNVKNKMVEKTVAPEFSCPLTLDELKSGERRELRLEADERARRALARRFGLERLDHLDAEITVWPIRDGVAIEGRFDAKGAQVCVVSFAPVPFEMEKAPIRLHLLKEDALRRLEEELGEAIFLDEIDHDLLEGEEIDLGEIVAQSLILALEPYPRAEGLAQETLKRHGLGDTPDDAEQVISSGEHRVSKGSPLQALGDLLAGAASGGKGRGGDGSGSQA